MARPVIVGFDGSPNSLDALVLGSALAESFAAPLLALIAYAPESAERLGTAPRMDRVRREHVVALAHATVVDRDVECRPVPVSSAAAALHLEAEREEARMLVVGSTHRSRVGRLLAGAVTQETLDAAPCPVAVAPAGLHRDRARLTTIGVGFDDSLEAHVALDLATRLARRPGRRLRVIGAIPRIDRLPPHLQIEGLEERLEETEVHWRRSIARATGELLARGVEVVTDIVRDEEVDALTERTTELDVLVLGSRGRGPALRVLVGSVARKVLERAACPVIVVPCGPSSRKAEQQAESAAGLDARR